MNPEQYSIDEAHNESSKMRDIVGPKGETQDYQDAEKQLEESLQTADWDSKFESAIWYKKNVEIRAVQATAETPITTVLADGHVETTNTAKPGDFIVTNPSGEQYVIDEEKFKSKYEPITNQAGHYKAVGTPIKAVQINSDVSFKAPWGEEMHMRAGDFIVDAGNGDRYGIAQKEFNETYVPAN
ncbi:MAG: PGDYG domain-containing protein [Candidatus Saccharibacteria bacterium]